MRSAIEPLVQLAQEFVDEHQATHAAHGGADTRLPRVLQAVLHTRIPLQQHHPAQPQPPALARPPGQPARVRARHRRASRRASPHRRSGAVRDGRVAGGPGTTAV